MAHVNKTYNKLLIDAHLGRLCKLLRFAGIDCKSAQHLSEGAIISLCLKENRLFLTRNTRLSANLRKLPHLVLKEIDKTKQLKEISQVIQYNEDLIYSRCTICNTQLLPAEIPSIKPDFMPENPINLKICPRCNQFYWQGSHHERMIKTLTEHL
ncbi:MAG: Mut7-C RNAse domain-containing protein [Candidatus Cloacimonadales bacterium]|nr:Mut7-C RNAse domain-containing protein [Candidatus Cloacimonadota bacterium]MDD2651121.1 Mut7-C RNAse domain-containing protein [Candidatus Cloacimonadota bacterium]MDD3502089.1 Mut7-C RNAse domain-containing protein [Candidatus Cloacimonadota bacterium]MDX9976779.1 Mut7-C RNAse domain-containing protein [Candidatus Cloacimonadales bacterium]